MPDPCEQRAIAIERLADTLRLLGEFNPHWGLSEAMAHINARVILNILGNEGFELVRLRESP